MTDPVSTERLEEILAAAEIEWDIHEDDNRAPRDFWHARIVWRGFASEWVQWGDLGDYRNAVPQEHKNRVEAALRNDLRAALTELLASRQAPEGVRVKPTHRHKERGTEYVLIGIGKMQAESWRDLRYGTESALRCVDMREVAIYRSATDPTEIWVRPREEFEDGRFEALKGANHDSQP